MQEGDHYITNDPWLGTGHLHDLTVVTPAFRRGRMVGLFANTAHVIDVGGLGLGPEARSVFEEGMYIPIVKCFDRGTPNETFFDILRAGTRLPVELEGDVYSLCACNDAALHHGRVRHRGPRRAGRAHLRRLAPRHAGRHQRPAPRHLSRQHRLRRLRGAGHAARRHDDPRGRDRGGLQRHLRPLRARHQRAAGVHARLRLVRHQGGGGAGGAQQLGKPAVAAHGDPGGLHPERPPARRRSPPATPSASSCRT